MQNDLESDELVQKRQRNRTAQQRYRKRLKSRIEDLEKRAAVADQLVKANETSISENSASSVVPCSNPIGAQDAASRSIPAIVGIPQTAAATTAASCIGESPASLQRKSNFTRSERGPNGDDDFLKGLLLSTYNLSSNQNPFFTDTGDIDIQQDHAEPMQTNLFSTCAEIEAPPNPLPSPSERYKSSSDRPLADPLPKTLPDLAHSGLEDRVDYVLQAIKHAGFPTIEAFVSNFYTASFQDQSAAQKAQQASHNRGLPMMLEELHLKSDDWPVWQARAYTDSIVRSAACIIAEEFDRLTKKSYECEKELQRCLNPMTPRAQMTPATPSRSPSLQKLHVAAAELRKTLRNELPNLSALTAALSTKDSTISQSTRVQLLVVTIKIITATGDEPLEEVANWVHHRLE